MTITVNVKIEEGERNCSSSYSLITFDVSYHLFWVLIKGRSGLKKKEEISKTWTEKYVLDWTFFIHRTAAEGLFCSLHWKTWTTEKGHTNVFKSNHMPFYFLCVKDAGWQVESLKKKYDSVKLSGPTPMNNTSSTQNSRFDLSGNGSVFTLLM